MLEIGRMTTIFVHSYESLRQTFPTRASEWALATITFNLGVVFLLNEELFKQSPSWSSLAYWAPQHVWGYVCLFLGGVRLGVLLVNGAYWRTPHFRSLLAFLTCFLWWSIAMGLFDNLALAAAIMPIFVLLDAFNARRTGTEIGKAEYLYRLQKKQEADAPAPDK